VGRSAALKLKIDGKGVSPASLSIDDLFFIVQKYRDAVLAHAGEDGQLEADEVIALIAVEEGSAAPCLRIPIRIRETAYALTESLGTAEPQKHPTSAHRILAEISKRCQQRGVFINLPAPRGKSFCIGAGCPFEVPEPLTFAEAAVLYGTVRNVGGAMPHAEIVVDDARAVKVYGEETLIVELGKYLYKPVGLEGEGTYDANTHQLKSFRAFRKMEFEEGDLLAAFEELAAVSEGVWDGIDPVKYVQALRADE
jgi:hypothetical protein